MFNGLSSGVDSISEALGFLGQIFAGIMQNEYASYAIVLICVAVVTATIFEAALAKLPIFQGSSSNGNKLAKIVAWCFSAIGVVGLHWTFGDQGMGGIILMFAGPMGVMILVGLVAFVWFSVYKSMENSRPAARRVWSTFAAGFVFFWLLGAINNGENYLGSFLTISLISLGIAGISYVVGKR